MAPDTRWNPSSILAATILAVGLAAGGLAAGHGMVAAKRVDRFVTVKGVAELDVEADFAMWPISVAATGNDLGRAQESIDASVAQVVAYLGSMGIDEGAISTLGTQITDRATDRYAELKAGQSRFIVTYAIVVRTTDLDAVEAAARSVGRLIESGVSLSTPDGYGYSRPTYVFNGLNRIKPGMIAEATASAREAAQRFADDSQSRVGGIRRANQGVFAILARDDAPQVMESTQRHKTVRVVSTIEYYLEG